MSGLFRWRGGLVLLAAQIAGTRRDLTVPGWLLRRAAAGGAVVSGMSGDRVVAVAPVRSAGRVIAVVALSRPTGRLEHTVKTFWLTLTLIGLGSLAAAVVIALGLARWVARPLAALDRAAGRLGGGDLRQRAPATAGPAEIRRLAATFNTMAARLEALLGSHRAVIADVSHQLRTPLTALRLRLDLLRPDPAADADAAAEFSGALGELARLSRLVDGLLAVARAENATPRPVPVPLARVIADRAAAWEPVAAEKGIGISASAQPAHALLGEGYLEQIIDNLVANAIDAGGDGNHVTVTAAATGGRVRITVADDGPGMSQAEMAEAFHRFSSASPGGTGLGLAIVDRLVTTCGGTTTLSTTTGGGLTVTINLPATPATRPGSRPQPTSQKAT
jgi:signal transduction histidine kinase